MKILIELTNPTVGGAPKQICIYLPFEGAEQYMDVAKISVSETGGAPSDINRHSFDCKLSVSKKGRMEISY